LKIDRWHKSETFKPYLRKLNFKSCTVVIFIAIDPVELQPLRDFESEADFTPPQRGELPWQFV
jgi:hypothetical protein